MVGLIVAFRSSLVKGWERKDWAWRVEKMVIVYPVLSAERLMYLIVFLCGGNWEMRLFM